MLLIPVLATLFTDEVEWGAEDFAIFGAMIILACGLYEIASDLIKRPAPRAAAEAALIGAFMIVWAELAVGLLH